MSKRILGPFSRVEGHLEIDLERSEDKVISARVNSPMFRGMETVMLNRTPMDALTIAPRICGICSVSQSVATARALQSLSGVEVPKNGELMTNLILACEVLANHLTHYYLFFMPDFARDIYDSESWFKDAQRFKAESGEAQGRALEARTKLLHIMGVLAGKWPHTLTIRPGGSTQMVKTTEKLKLKTILRNFRKYLEGSVYGSTLEEVTSLTSLGALQNWQENNNSDLAFFLNRAEDLLLERLGVTQNLMMSGGGFSVQGAPTFKQGVYNKGKVSPLNVSDIREDISHSFMGGETLQSPEEGISDPYLDKPDAYSWCKAPRLNGERVEVGALARHLINQHPLFEESYQQTNSNVKNRILARNLEMAELVLKMESWIDQIEPDDTFYNEADFPSSGQALAFVEAARGTLGHWISIENGLIRNYQIIAPTTWNFSPRDQNGLPGPLEAALEGASIKSGEEDPINVQHIVRSFDPCMACTVH